MKNLKYFERGSKGVLFDDGKWLIWPTDASGHPVHGAVLMKHKNAKHKPCVFVLFSGDKSWLDIAIDSDDVCDARVWSVIDKTIGYTADTTMQVDASRGDKFSGSMSAYFRRCGKQFEENPSKKGKHKSSGRLDVRKVRL